MKMTRRNFVVLGMLATSALTSGIVPSVSYALTPSDRRMFTDSLGRQVEIPVDIVDVTPAGVCAQTIITQIDAGKLASAAMSPAREDGIAYYLAGNERILGVPETGTIEGSTSHDIDIIEVAEVVSPTLVIDAGLARENLVESLNSMQKESGIPHIFINASFGKLPQAYRTIGEILGCDRRGKELALYVEDIFSETLAIADRALKYIKPPKVFYAPRTNGICPNSGTLLQLDALRHLGAIPVENPYNIPAHTVDLNALTECNVDIIIFDDTNVSDSLKAGCGTGYDTWMPIIEHLGCSWTCAPALYHSWLGNIVLVQSVGLLWLAHILYPEYCDWFFGERASTLFEALYDLPANTRMVSDLIEESKI